MKPKATYIQAIIVVIAILIGSQSIFAATTASQLAFTAQPTNTVVGAPLSNIVVQLKDAGGTNVAQSGVTIQLALNKTGLSGTASAVTDSSGKVTFKNLTIASAGSGYKFTASATGLRSATSASFNINKGSTLTKLTSSTNLVAYGQSVTLTASVSVVAPASGAPTGLVTFRDGIATLGTAAVNAAGVATFATNRISAVNGVRNLSAVYGGDTNFLTSTSSNLAQSVSALALTVSGIIASNKIYDGTTNATLNFSNATLATVLTGDAVTLNTALAKGYFTDRSSGSGKTVLILGLTLAGANAGSYSLKPSTVTASITPRSLVITAKGANKVYDGSTNATVTLSDNRLAVDVFTNGYKSAGFANKNVGTANIINVNGLFIGGTNAGNYSLSNLAATATANITSAGLTVSGIVASNKVYDGTTAAALNVTAAKLYGVFSGDSVALSTASAKGVFADKNIGTGKAVQVSGLTISGTDAGNYVLTQPKTNANITVRSLTIIAKGVNKIYDGTTNATVTLSDNRVAGDGFTDGYASACFTNKNVGTNILINVNSLAITGAGATNYVLFITNTATTANITKAALAISGAVASNKIYDGTTTATLNFSNATLTTIFAGDTVTLNTTTVKGLFAGKNAGTNIAITISGLALAGTNAGNYSVTPPALFASILPRSLVITASGVNKTYDGTTSATVTLADNHLTADAISNSYAAATFTNKNAGTNILINVTGLAITGTGVANYVLAATNTTASANISPAPLTVAAANLSRPYATTNPILTAVYSGFVANESLTNSDITGTPALATTAKTNSNVGTYPITISKGTLASADYSFIFTNGILTITKADTAALLSTTVNPALTNQNITFAATVTPLATTVLPPSGLIQFRCNGTNKLGAPISLAGNKANYTVLAATLGQAKAVITAEYSDPTGNFNSSTNTLTQNIATVAMPPQPSKLSLQPAFANGAVNARIAGAAGVTYIVEASTDLLHWIPISTNVADTAGVVSLVDSNAVALPNRFYRAYSP